MKIAVTSAGPTLEDEVDHTIGRCRYFLFVETDDLSFQAVENPMFSVAHCPGIPVARLVAEKGAKTLLTGVCGPNAYQVLQAAGVDVIAALSGKVKTAVERFKAGELSPMTKEQELEWLKGQPEYLADRLQGIKKRLRELEQEPRKKP